MAQPAPAVQAPQAKGGGLRGNDVGGGDGFSAAPSSSTGQGINSNAISAALAMMALAENPVAQALSPVNAAIAGLLGQAMADGQIGGISDAFGALGSIGSPTSPGSQGVFGMGTISDAHGNVSSISNDGMIAASDAAMFGGDAAPSAGPGSSAGHGGGDGGHGMDGGFAYAKGGRVTKNRLIGPNPPGADDGFGALAHGEFVIKADTANRLGAKALKALNEGRARIVMS
jgi:hypothetical protein